ncbi:hypothetical protein CGLO_14243 [Colletotrichum gloeosporioides Cg-14]|uniref:Uncharacterized protein n=1 Tax=Colletotrichum gloeosporioides (strain Cg-14) TaxID=1237896 RepID=T0LE68_COLGC|nr:hypothetical protein CGLO_14243 [Colletotrichum gloeosporioides Cg-14]
MAFIKKEFGRFVTVYQKGIN